MNPNEYPNLFQAIEAAMDKHSINAVLATVAQVLMEKADHLRVNWQDETNATRLEKAAADVDRAGARVDPL